MTRTLDAHNQQAALRMFNNPEHAREIKAIGLKCHRRKTNGTVIQKVCTTPGAICDFYRLPKFDAPASKE